MMDALEWTYEKRDFISYSSAFTLSAVLVLIFQFSATQIRKNDDLEMTAFIEHAIEPEVMKPVEPLKKIIEKVQPQKSQEFPQPKPIPSPFATAEATKEVKHQETPSSAEKSVAPQPPVPAPSSVPQSVTPSVAGIYEAQLRAYLEKIKRYPTSREARLTRPQGAVRIWLELSRSGQLLGIGVLSSSGSNLLDGEALKTLRNGTFPAIPDEAFVGEISHKFSATLSYTLEGQ